MSFLRFLPLVRKGITRNRGRSLLTITSVTVAMFLFTSVEALQVGVRRATEVTANDTTLVVYREDRYCPFSSRLPQSYQARIESIEHVQAVVPVRVVVSNCRTSLDVVTFRGVPEEAFVREWVPDFEIVAGSVADWRSRGDAALLGEALAARRGVKVGDRFTAAGISVYVAGVLGSDDPQHRNVAYTHLPFIQETADRAGSGGIVTQFNVTVDAPDRLDEVASAIDVEFEADQEPTSTSPEKAFVAKAARDLVDLVDFASWLGYGSLLAILALVGNAIVLAVQERVRDHAVFQTLGYRGSLVAKLILAEGASLGLIGGVIGAVGAHLFLSQGRFSLAMEGLNVEVVAESSTVLTGFLLSASLGAVASVIPAWQASRREIVQCFRTA